MTPELSIVVPVYNEEESLPELFRRVLPVLDGLSRSYELILVDDGSRDRSLALSLKFREKREDRVKVVELNGNFGQHMAIIAGFSISRGRMVITMDADLQNPPEEIPRIVAAMERGHDMVGTIRKFRQDPLFRKAASKMVNTVTNRITGLRLHDYGCMLRGYDRRIVDLILLCRETTTFIPALGQKFAVNPVEITVRHSERAKGESKYGLFRLIRLNFDLMTGFSIAPLQAVTVTGMTVAAMSLLFTAFLILRRIIVGPEAEGLFTLMAINFFLMGVTMISVGIGGEYIGRVYQEVRQRPRYVVRQVYQEEEEL
ncbi:glycosyl transferase family 2 [Dethiosulfovibrio peptidovorans DSM 11002]|jgi:undecaprenyl-phosphate 4-deoxy-4-formamido-L-arabinose transferase|uniref:Glycosyl transferase family 2 n=1 Tax=Dethiosulfovibrio peptidovorans DSM 11002 TaxID=469381 RepID=D2Z577_9BACT|nr:glycosyltransferase [Dethiosulfovibrio peptidovorans]EFC90636.1 glycosyl transferase family 2 [Dethiosulfovibrio peptidovorans DSM 11002]